MRFSSASTRCKRQQNDKMTMAIKLFLTATFAILFGATSVSAPPGELDGDVPAELPPEMAAGAPTGGPGSPASKILAKTALKTFVNASTFVTPEMSKQVEFCISDMNAEWDAAFNFSKNTDFFARCLDQNRDAMRRLCTAAEVKFYGSGLVSADSGSTKSGGFLKLNQNCNLNSWPPGCEPGWACTAPKEVKVNFKNSKDMPLRNVDCKPCCEGFFCPQGLTCMLPCPLGSYCPMATLNSTTGVCDPYTYQLPPGQSNHTCGGADIWADFLRGKQIFCTGGSYCPTTTQKLPCSKGHYCRAGATAQKNCYTLATCNAQAENQNITAYGIIFFGGITLVLMIIYNCSGQVISTREKKQAKSREAAARCAKETVEARAKWKSAKDVARKGAELGSQLSRTFTRKKSTSVAAGKDSKSGSDPKLPPGAADSKGKKKKTRESNLTKMMRDIEENSDNEDGFNVEIGDKNMKKNAGKAKQLHTRSQIFKYAYGQIEKEKALQEQTNNLTFSGVISIASDMEISARPPIEVFFQDLTLTLRGKDKHLLRCVTGKFIPGHVSAVMGPSGAGKTTFLSALTGKATGCTITGSILINGKNEPMRCYKKIIGYVPQDDIVHGNLTVEENLWFSARCRLQADLPKQEKVLVVERVIESLGLQFIRDSLVGTVEKRGISGGQRKRVNVGLEMVMEPSLLILDEPTSGLDSSSSLLLLRALRREAIEGVNICMVLHQPSYTLYRMFDDLILLAKGGLTVYHGPVKKVEEYFTGLGIEVPERVNPPDFFIDILEGILKPDNPSAVNYKELPLRWMLHNGYAVPPDMLETAAPAPGADSGDGKTKHDMDTSFFRDLFQDVKFSVGQKLDKILHNFTKSVDLSERDTPNVFMQYKYFLGRVGKQKLREARSQAVDYLILLLAGICLGTLTKVSDESFGSTGYLYTVIAVSLLTKISALRSFSLDKLHYWRESASGISSLAYFMAKDTIDHFNTIVKPAVYLSMFYFFNNPRSSIFENYLVLVCLVYCVTGIAYNLAIYFEPGPAQLWSVLLPVVLTLIANQDGNTFTNKVGDFCYPKWALEAFLLTNAHRYSGVWLIQRCGVLRQKGYDLKHYHPCLIYLVAAGIASRCFAYFILITFQKK